MNQINATCAGQSWHSIALDVMAQFDPVSPGKGTDAHTGELVLEHAMAYALYASSAKLLGMDDDATIACRWLENDAKKASGAMGWGLPFEWDAFADGDPNPVDTVYGITTALSVKALVDCSPPGEVNQTAVLALEYYLRNATTKTADGIFFWYSDQADDAKSVYNISSMLAGQFARVGMLLGREDFVEAARSAASDLLAHRQEGKNGFYWKYGADVDRPNDAVHASYIVQGAIELKRWLDIDIGLQFSLMYLRKFFRKGLPYEYVKHEGLLPKRRKARARPWGAGMLLYTACESDDRHLRNLAEEGIRKVFPPKDDAIGVKSSHPRHLAHIAIGLARASIDAKTFYCPQPADPSGEDLVTTQPHIVSLVMNGVVGDGRVIKTAKAAQEAGYKATLLGMTAEADPVHMVIESVPVILVPNRIDQLKADGFWPGDKTKRRLGALSDSVARSMLPVIESLGPSLLHSHDMSGLRIGAVISRALAARGNDIPWIHDIHEFVAGLTTVPDNFRTTCMEYERRYLRQADHLITVSEPLAEVVQSSYALRTAPTVVYNAPIATSEPIENVGDVRSAIGLPRETPLVVYIGVAKKERGCETILSAVASLPDVHLCFVSDSTAYLKNLQTLAAELGIAHRLHLHPYVSGSEVTSFIRTADLGTHGLVHYPNGEVAMPNKLFEYIHAGLPVVVSDVAAMKQFVHETKIGAVFTAENAMSCANAIRDVLRNKERYRSAIGSELKDHYSWEGQAEKLRKIYADLLSRRRSGTLVLSSDISTSNGLAAKHQGHSGVVSSKSPSEGMVDFYYDPSSADDRAGLLTRVANRYETIFIERGLEWPDALDREALVASGVKVLDLDPREEADGENRETTSEMVLMTQVEARQLAFDRTVADLLYSKESAECTLANRETAELAKIAKAAAGKTASQQTNTIETKLQAGAPKPTKAVKTGIQAEAPKPMENPVPLTAFQVARKFLYRVRRRWRR